MATDAKYSMENVLPDIIRASESASRILVFVHYADDQLCSLNDLREFDGLKIAIINERMAKNAPTLMRNMDAFDLRVDYPGPVLAQVTYGNKAWLDLKGKSDVIVPPVYHAVTKVIDGILSVFKDRDNIYLYSPFEEILMQLAVLRERYGLTLGLSVEKAERFIVKPKMKECWEENGLNHAKYAVLNARELRGMSKTEVEAFVDQKLPPFPLFVKPCAAASAFETRRIPDRAAFSTWIADSKNMVYNDFLIEEYMFYPYYLVTVLCTPTGFMVANMSESTDEYSYSRLVEFGENGMERMMSEDEEIYQKVAKMSIEVIKSGGITREYGTYFLEMVHKADGSLAPMEMAARPPAGLSGTNSYELYTGIDVESFAMMAPWGYMPKIHEKKYKHVLLLGLNAKQSGTLIGYNDIDPLLIEAGAELPIVEMYWDVGERVSKIPKTMDSLAMNIVVAGNEKEAVHKTARNILDKHDPMKVQPL